MTIIASIHGSATTNVGSTLQGHGEREAERPPPSSGPLSVNETNESSHANGLETTETNNTRGC
jgi:hypothetical protein